MIQDIPNFLFVLVVKLYCNYRANELGFLPPPLQVHSRMAKWQAWATMPLQTHCLVPCHKFFVQSMVDIYIGKTALHPLQIHINLNTDKILSKCGRYFMVLWIAGCECLPSSPVLHVTGLATKLSAAFIGIPDCVCVLTMLFFTAKSSWCFHFE